MTARERKVGGLGERGEGLKNKLVVIDGHGAGKHNIGNAVSLNLMARWRARRVIE